MLIDNTYTDTYISLGDTCAIAYQLQRLNLKDATLPFDWILSPNIDMVLNSIECCFTDFINETYLETKNTLNNCSKINENWDDLVISSEQKYKGSYCPFGDDCIINTHTNQTDNVDNTNVAESITSYIIKDHQKDDPLTLRVVNTKYKFTFMHDFTPQNTTEELKIIKDKYDRRGNRFYLLMYDPYIHKHIYRITIGHAQTEVRKIDVLFQKMKFVNYSIHVKTYKDLGPSTDWKFNDFNWYDWFTN
jgi:hypothetical protein